MSNTETLNLLSEKAAETFFTGTVAPHHYAPVPEDRLYKAHETIDRLIKGRVSVAEAFTTSDLDTLAIFQVINTKTMGAYQTLESKWREYTDVTSTPDFRPTRLVDVWEDDVVLQHVPELTEYPQVSGEGHDIGSITVRKYGLRDGWSWESTKNGTLPRSVKNAPTKYSKASARTETLNALSNLLKVDLKTGLADGINTAFFKAGNGNAVDTRPLTAENLDAVLDELDLRTPKRGSKDALVATPDYVLVIPKAMERRMEQIQALRQIRKTVGTNTEVFDNYLKNVDYVIEPELDRINKAANAKTTWFVLPKPGQARPASFVAFMDGYETPDMRYRADAGQRLGGGMISPLEGSFEIDGIETRVRHIVGHETGDPTFTYASTGA